MIMNNQITIGKRCIGQDNAPYIIAEVGVNHEGSMKRAKEFVRYKINHDVRSMQRR